MRPLVQHAKSRLRIAVYSMDSVSYACAMIRILGPLQHENCEVIWAVKQDGSKLSVNLSAANGADLIIIQRHFPSSSTEGALRTIFRSKVPIIYDTDDSFLDTPVYHPLYLDLKKRFPYIKWTLNEADVISVSTESLRQVLRKHTIRPIHVQPNLVDWDLFQTCPRPQHDTFNFLIAGTPTHSRDWSIIEEPLAKILKLYSNRTKVFFFGEPPKRFLGHSSVHHISFDTNYFNYAATLKKLDVHAALVPLEDTQFNRCKSNIKWLEYSAAGIVGAYSDVTPYRSSILNGENGLLVCNTEYQWFATMEALLKTPNMGIHMIERARREVAESHSLHSGAAGYVALYDDMLGRKHTHKLLTSFLFHIHSMPTRVLPTARRWFDSHILWRFK